MTTFEIILISSIGLLALICLFLIFQMRNRQNEIINLCEYSCNIDDRLLPLRLNFLWGLRQQLIQVEDYERVQFINELIAEEFGKEYLKGPDFNQMWDQVDNDEDE